MKRPWTRRVEEREEITAVALATRRWALRLENKRLTRRNWEQRICGEWSRAAHPRIFLWPRFLLFKGKAHRKSPNRKIQHIFMLVSLKKYVVLNALVTVRTFIAHCQSDSTHAYFVWLFLSNFFIFVVDWSKMRVTTSYKKKPCCFDSWEVFLYCYVLHSSTRNLFVFVRYKTEAPYCSPSELIVPCSVTAGQKSDICLSK